MNAHKGHPHHHHCNATAREVERRLKVDKFPAAASQATAATGTVTVLASLPTTTPVDNNTPLSVPSGSYMSVPAQVAYQSLSVAVNLALADKLAVGNMLAVSIWMSTDGTDATASEVASIAWTSYGPGGNPGDPRQGIPANPDPTINFNLAPFLGNYAQLRYEFSGAITEAGATVSGNTLPVG